MMMMKALLVCLLGVSLLNSAQCERRAMDYSELGSAGDNYHWSAPKELNTVSTDFPVDMASTPTSVPVTPTSSPTSGPTMEPTNSPTSTPTLTDGVEESTENPPVNGGDTGTGVPNVDGGSTSSPESGSAANFGAGPAVAVAIGGVILLASAIVISRRRMAMAANAEMGSQIESSASEVPSSTA